MKVNAINMLRLAGDALHKCEPGLAYGLHEMANNLLEVMSGHSTMEEWGECYVVGTCTPLDLDKHLRPPKVTP